MRAAAAAAPTNWKGKSPTEIIAEAARSASRKMNFLVTPDQWGRGGPPGGLPAGQKALKGSALPWAGFRSILPSGAPGATACHVRRYGDEDTVTAAGGDSGSARRFHRSAAPAAAPGEFACLCNMAA